MLSEFLKDYLSIILFLIIALGLSVAFIVINFVLSTKKNQTLKNYQLTNVVLNLLTIQEWNLMLDFYLVAISIYYI